MFTLHVVVKEECQCDVIVGHATPLWVHVTCHIYASVVVFPPLSHFYPTVTEGYISPLLITPLPLTIH